MISDPSSVGESWSEGKLIAADCINRPQEFMLSKKIIAENLPVDAARLVDEAISVKELF
ncbi:MAG: oxidoreductase C-terminal domain-containing protein [Agitococcus sp.]